MAYEDFKEGCSVIKGYVDDQNKETVGKIPTKVSELTNDSKYATEGYVEEKIGQISQPSSLPQTYKKKAVTLATSGWEQFYDNKLVGTVFNYNGLKGDKIGLIEGETYTVVTNITENGQTTSHTETSVCESTTGVDYVTQGFLRIKCLTSGSGTAAYGYIYDEASAMSTPFSTTNITRDANSSFVRPRNSNSDITYKIMSITGKGIQNNGRYTYTDADVKVNSEVRFTLDEANGKLAGQFGLKKTIDKEAGKLTFTADTLPTSAISGTLEIGDTSTEGAAFVEGISEDIKDEPVSSQSAIKIGRFYSNQGQKKCGLFMLFLENSTPDDAHVYVFSNVGRDKYSGFAEGFGIKAFGTEDGTLYYPLQHITGEWSPHSESAASEDTVIIKNTDTTTHTVSATIFFALQEVTA